MIDLHIHILAGVDDGARSMKESIGMAREASNNGVETVVTTPHLIFGAYNNTPEIINSKVGELKSVLSEEEIKIEILAGAEVYLAPDLLSKLRKDEVATINNNGRYLLLELPMTEIPRYLNQVIFDLATYGVTSILSHPERNLRVIEDPTFVFNLVKDQRIVVQLNAGSLLGRYGKKVKETAEFFVKEDLAHILASDYHFPSKGGYPLSMAVERVAKLANGEVAQALVTTIPSAILEGRVFGGKDLMGLV